MRAKIAVNSQAVAIPIIEQCSSCGSLYRFLITREQFDDYYNEPREKLIQSIFPRMHHLARGVLSQGNLCALCVTPTDEAKRALAPHAFDQYASIFLRRNVAQALHVTRYLSNGRPALVILHDPTTLQTITTNIPEIPLAGNEVIVPDYGGFEGLREELASQLFIEDAGRSIGDNYEGLYICKLTAPLIPSLSEPQAVIATEEAERHEGFVPGSDRRYRYVEGGETAPPAARRGDAIFQIVEEVYESAPGAKALLENRSPLNAEHVPVHIITRRRQDGKLFSRKASEQVAREVVTPAKAKVIIPHNAELAGKRISDVDECAFSTVVKYLHHSPNIQQAILVSADYSLEEISAFYIEPPEENPRGYLMRMLFAGVFTYAVDETTDIPLAFSAYCTPVKSIAKDRSCDVLYQPPCYIAKLNKGFYR